MQKAMEQMNVKLTNVISDILGKSGQAIIAAILEGNHDPESLAGLAAPRCKKSKEEIALSLEATWDEDHLFELKQSYDQYRFYQKQIEECDAKNESLMKQYSAKMDTDRAKLVRTKKRVNKKNSTKIDVDQYAYSLWGVNVMAIPGMSANSILQLIGELGHDFVDKFDTAAKFCRWCNIVPNTKISGGKILSSKVPKRKNPVGQIFRTCANALKDSKETLGFYFRRMKSKNGHMQAIVAAAHKLAKIFYTMIKSKVEYDATKVGQDEKELLKRKIERTQKASEKLNAKLSDAA